MLFQKKLPVSWLIAGLGNPGDQYENTRHNAGFLVADELGERGGFPIQRLRFKGKRLFARFPDGLVAGIHIKSYP